MLQSQIKVGGLYTAKVAGKLTTVRVDAIRSIECWVGLASSGKRREQPRFDVTNLATGRKVTFRSAAKFRSEVVKKAVAADPTSAACAPDHSAASSKERNRPFVPTATTLPTSSPDAVAVATATPTAVLEGEQSHPPILATADPAQSVTATAAGTLAPASSVGFARKLAMQQPTTALALTDEQVAILEAAQQLQDQRGNGLQVLVIGAGAGTGKTYTLKQLEMVLRGNGQYTAFNTSLVAESKAKFKRAACNTTHSLAFKAVGRFYAHRLRGVRVRSAEIARVLGISDFYVTLAEMDEDGKPRQRRLPASFLAGQVLAAVRRFCQSADSEIGEDHLGRVSGIDTVVDGVRQHRNSNQVRAYLLPFAHKAWADLIRTDGVLPFAHDVYVKLWQLGQGDQRPVIAADYILLDEHQDTAPVFLDVLKRQNHALLILVGDDNQRIYEWRGAVNAGAEFPSATRRLLSQSFRFGQTVADVANSILATLDEPTDLVMKGLPSIPSRVCQVARPRCFLYRTNAGAVGRLMQAWGDNQRGHLIGGTAEVVDFCQAVVDLQAGRGTSHHGLGCFSDWQEVVKYSKEEEGQDMRLMVRLIEQFGAATIHSMIKNMPSEEQADFVTTTAHKSKGREWSSVKLGADFPLSNALTDADRRLLYVAATRAQEELDISECPTFCGGYDRHDTGNAETSGGWVPGLPIHFTAPMPSEDELKTYQAGRLCPTIAPNPVPAPGITPTADPGASNAVASANGTGGAGDAAKIGFTWANMDGQWLVRGPSGFVNKEVVVTKRSGATNKVMLKAVAKVLGDLHFYTVR